MALLVNDVTPRVQYTATASQTVFAYPFAIFADADLKVYLTPTGSSADDTADIITLTTNYTVSGAATTDGGNVTLVVAATAGDIITIIRDIPVARAVDYQNLGDLASETFNDDLDKQVMLTQQNERELETRVMKLRRTDSKVSNLELPVPVAGQVLAWNSAEDGLENSTAATEQTSSATQIHTTDIAAITETPNTITTAWYDTNKVIGSGAIWVFTNTTTAGNAGLGLHTDGYVYNANGDQYQITGIPYVEQFGAGPALSAAINTTAFDLAFNTQSVISASPGTFTLNNLNYTGTSSKIFSCSGPSTVLDFSGVTSGDAFSFGWDAGNGGCKYITLEKFNIKDSSVSSSADTLLSFVGGPAGGSPSQTSGFLTLRDVNMVEFNNSSGIGIEIDGLSHVLCESVYQEHEWGCGEGWLLSNTANVNTGVWTFTNCSFRGEKRALRVNATGTLMDTATFPGCFFANHTNAAAVETILFEGTQIISGFDFSGTHLECRHASDLQAILVTGDIRGCDFSTMHMSCGTASDQSVHGFKFEGAIIRACNFNGIEFLRVKTAGSSGVCFYFDNTCNTNPDEPIQIKGIWRNATTPYAIEAESGGNQDTIYKSIISDPTSEDRRSTGTNKVYELEDSATPSVKGGKTFEITSAWGSGNITDFIDEYKGQHITIINSSGGTVTLTHGTSTIRCKGGANLDVLDDGTANFVRTSVNHWIQRGEAIDT